MHIPPFPARLTHHEAPAFLASLSRAVRALAPGQVAVLNVGALQTFDSSALAVCLGVLRSAQERGVGLEWQAVPPRLQGLAQLYGLGELLHG